MCTCKSDGSGKLSSSFWYPCIALSSSLILQMKKKKMFCIYTFILQWLEEKGENKLNK